MGGKDAPSPPDFGPIARAAEKSADLSFKLGQDQLAWAKQQFGYTSDITNKVVSSALQTQALNNQAAAQDRQRYQGIFQPMEDELAADAQAYASGERRDQQQGRAMALVNSQFTQQRNNALQHLESFGVDPSSTRFAALDIGTRASQAAASAAAGNQAAQVVDAQGRALRSEAINVGRGYPGQVAQTYGTSLNAGNQAAGTAFGNVASGANTMGTAPQWQQIGNQGLGIWGNTLQMGFQDQLASWQAEQGASSGWGSALGAGLGLLKGVSGMSFEEGGQVPQPVGDAGPGVVVPYSASPSGGAVTDDVPAVIMDRQAIPTGPAQINAGEFIVPRDVTEWLGQKGLQDIINKARKEQAGASAKPQQEAPPQQAIPDHTAPAYARGGPVILTQGNEAPNPTNNPGGAGTRSFGGWNGWSGFGGNGGALGNLWGTGDYSGSNPTGGGIDMSNYPDWFRDSPFGALFSRFTPGAPRPRPYMYGDGMDHATHGGANATSGGGY